MSFHDVVDMRAALCLKQVANVRYYRCFSELIVLAYLPTTHSPAQWSETNFGRRGQQCQNEIAIPESLGVFEFGVHVVGCTLVVVPGPQKFGLINYYCARV